MPIDPLRAGRCYELAFLKMCGHDGPLPSPGVVIVHGYPRLTAGPDEGCLFGHAWLEWDEPLVLPGFMEPVALIRMCWDPVAQISSPAAMYYSAGRIDPDQTTAYTLREASRAAVETESYGPWNAVPDDALFD